MLDLLTRISTLYNIPQWAVNVGAITIFIILVAFPFVAKKLLEPKHYKFKALTMYNVIWQWKYKKNDIVGLWCHCPKCHAMLVCDDENCRATDALQAKITFFVCNDCGGHEQGRVVGGDRRYAISLVKREALRQIRSGDYVATMKTAKELKDAIAAFEILQQTREEQEANGEIHSVEEQKSEETPDSEVTLDQVEEPLLLDETEPLLVTEEILSEVKEEASIEKSPKEVVEEESKKEDVEHHGV